MFKAGPYHSYPGVISPGDPSRQMTGVSTHEVELYGGRWSAEDIKRDDEASTLARALLAKMGRSGATTAEMQAIRANLRCGRCIQTLPGTWESLVLHYRREQTNWKQAQDKIYENPKSDFVYHNIHDLGPGSSRPFAHYMTPEAAADYALENTTHEPYIMTCIPCERMGIIANHLHSFNEGAETPMVQHLRDVHDIAEAVFGLHFQRWAFDLDFVDPFDDEDEDESEDGDEGEDEYWVW
ncbi:hypothetical protein FRC12_024339 [Ceratobasidium sp. 428]|nr:hypothetical protein FRC12_024339 [Ceratobasidium sp. 428]